MPFTSHTEWDPLKTMMVADIDVTNKDIKSDIFKLEGKLLSVLVNRTKSMLDKVSNILVKKGVKVIRPDPTKFKGSHRFPVLNIRDRLGVIDNKLILFSSEESVRGMEDCIDLNIDYKFPQFPDEEIWEDCDNNQLEGIESIKNNQPYLDAANLIRCGNIIFSTLKNTGNKKGLDHLKNIISDDYTIVPITTVENHLDGHVLFVNENLMLHNAQTDISEFKPYIPNTKTVPILYRRYTEWGKFRVGPNPPPQIPKILWEDLQDDDVENTNLYMSNTISIDPETVICLNAKPEDTKFWKKYNINCIAIDWPEQWVVNAGLHCFTVDLERDGKMRNPFDKT